MGSLSSPATCALRRPTPLGARPWKLGRLRSSLAMQVVSLRKLAESPTNVPLAMRATKAVKVRTKRMAGSLLVAFTAHRASRKVSNQHLQGSQSRRQMTRLRRNARHPAACRWCCWLVQPLAMHVGGHMCRGETKGGQSPGARPQPPSEPYRVTS